jgi:hypothetical protein
MPQEVKLIKGQEIQGWLRGHLTTTSLAATTCLTSAVELNGFPIFCIIERTNIWIAGVVNCQLYRNIVALLYDIVSPIP